MPPKRKGKKIELELKRLENASLDALWSLCPKCGQKAENEYCKDCDFHYKKGYVYFSGCPIEWK